MGQYHIPVNLDKREFDDATIVGRWGGDRIAFGPPPRSDP